MLRYALVALLVATSLAVPAPDSGAAAGTSLDCLQHEDPVSCLAVKAATSLDRAARAHDMEITEGISFVKDKPTERSGKSLKSENELMNELPRDASDRTLQLAGMLFESAMSFFKSHSLKLSMPEGSVSRALVEGRGKLKKFMPVIAAIAVKLFALVPILFGGLALLVAKALFVGKIALLIAGVLAFQRLFGSGANSGSPFGSGFPGSIFGKSPSSSWYEGGQGSWNAAGSPSAPQSQGYYRSFGDDVDAQKLAYKAQAPLSSNEAH